jgi:hypothetical protein
MKIKNYLELIGFLIVFVICFLFVSDFLEEGYAKEKYSPLIENSKKTNYDVLFMGSSHTYNSLLCQDLWKEFNITSYNCGSGCVTLPIDYYLLQQMSVYTKPKAIFVDLYGLCEYDELEGSNGKYKPGTTDKYRVQFDKFPLTKLKIDSVNDIFDNRENNLDFFFNLAIYHNRWKDITKENFEPRDIPQNGSAFLLGTKPVDYTEYKDAEHFQIEARSRDYIDKIYNYCEENNIQLIFTYLPYVCLSDQANVAYSFDEIIKYYPNAKYLNLLNTGLINYNTDIYLDASHLNYLGAYKITMYIGEYIKDNYPELIHNDAETVGFWNDYYEEYIDYKISRFEENELINDLQLVYGTDFYGALIENPNALDKITANSDLQALIKELGSNLTIQVDEKGSIKSDLLLIVYTKDNDKEVFRTEFKF